MKSQGLDEIARSDFALEHIQVGPSKLTDTKDESAEIYGARAA